MTDIERILQSEYNFEFDEIRKKMMTTSYYKYGSIKENYRTGKTIDAIKSLKMRIAKYEETGNVEFLADAGNFCMIEFTFPQHKNAHYKASDSGTCRVAGMGVSEIKRL